MPPASLTTSKVEDTRALGKADDEPIMPAFVMPWSAIAVGIPFQRGALLIVDLIWGKRLFFQKTDQQKKQKTPGVSRPNMFPAVSFDLVPHPVRRRQMVNVFWFEASSLDQQATVCSMSAFNLCLTGKNFLNS